MTILCLGLLPEVTESKVLSVKQLESARNVPADCLEDGGGAVKDFEETRPQTPGLRGDHKHLTGDTTARA